MANKELIIKNCPATLHVIKEKGELFGILSSGIQINKRPLREYTLPFNEGETIDVIINGKDVIWDRRPIATFATMFDSDVIVSVKKNDAENHCVYFINQNKTPVVIFTEKIPDPHMYDRRDSFPVNIKNDVDWTIVRYANLHQHTEYSLLDGITRIPDLAKKSEWACAITDHGNMHGFNEFYSAMKKRGKKPIIGCEVYVETFGGKPRPVFIPNETDTEGEVDIMFGNERIPNSSLAGEHMILLAENNVGLINLFNIVTKSSEHFYRKPHVTFELLREFHEGIIATSACIAGTLGRSVREIIKCEKFPTNAEAVSVMKENKEIAEGFIREMLDIFGRDHFFIELQDHHFEAETLIMDRIREIAKEHNLRTTIGIDAHYLNKEDKTLHELWLCQQTKTTMDNPKRMKFSGDRYHVHTSDEVLALFPNDLESLDNTLEIAERCSVVMEHTENHMPIFPLPEGFESPEKYMRHLIIEGYEKLVRPFIKSQEEYQKYVERIRYEMDVIIKMGFATYFLVVADFIAYAKDTNIKDHIDRYFPANHFDKGSIPEKLIKDYEIYVGSGRGSAAGSLVAYCMGITKVDPMKYGLLFERFLNPDRVSLPDIDTDFEDSGREQVMEYCRYKYGIDNTARVITFTTCAAKNAIRTICRVLGKSIPFQNELAKLIPNEPKITIKGAMESIPELLEKYNSSDEVKEVMDYAMKIEGLKSSRSIHACGVLLGDKPIGQNYTPLILMDNPQNRGEKIWCTQIQGPECESMGLIKMDFLGLRTLGVAHECVNLIKENHGVEINYDDIPLDDLDVYKFLAEGKTTGVFQAESDVFTETMTGVLVDFNEQNAKVNRLPVDKQEKAKKLLGEKFFMRISDCNALVRPGPSQYINDYEKCIVDQSKVQYADSHMRNQLESTNGIMLYQEQAMGLVREMAGFSAGQSDTIRKGTAKKKEDLLNEYEEYFVTGSAEKNIPGCVKNGIPEEIARKVWADIKEFGKYSFNKSHAVAYSFHTVRTAWLACKYPAEYMTALINSYIGKDADKVKGYIAKCKRIGISVYPPSVNESESDFSTTGDGIRFGIGGLKNIGSSADLVIEERRENGKFTDLDDFIYRMSSNQKCEKKMLDSLIKSGALDDFEGSRKSKLEKIPELLKYAKFVKEEVKDRYTLFDVLGVNNRDHIKMTVALSDEEMSDEEKLKFEKEIIGYYASGNPLDKYTRVLAQDEITQISDLLPNETEEDQTEDPSEKTSDVKLQKKTVNVAGIVKSSEIKRKKSDNSKFYIFTVEDMSAEIKCIFFPKEKEDFIEDTLSEDSLVFVTGSVKINDFGSEIMVTQILPLSYYDSLLKMSKLFIAYSSEDDVSIKRVKDLIKGSRSGSVAIYYEDRFSRETTQEPKKVKVNYRLHQEIVDTVGRDNIRYEF